MVYAASLPISQDRQEITIGLPKKYYEGISRSLAMGSRLKFYDDVYDYPLSLENPSHRYTSKVSPWVKLLLAGSTTLASALDKDRIDVAIIGSDILRNYFQIPYSENLNEGLRDRGILYIDDFGFRPVFLGLAALKRYGLKSLPDFIDKFNHKQQAKIAAEQDFTARSMFQYHEIGDHHYVVIKPENSGDLELHTFWGDTHGTWDVVDRGGTLKEFGLEPAILIPSTPRLVVSQQAYEQKEGPLRNIIDRLVDTNRKSKTRDTSLSQPRLPSEWHPLVTELDKIE